MSRQRDEFAAQAMLAILQKTNIHYHDKDEVRRVAKAAFIMADAMVSESYERSEYDE